MGLLWPCPEAERRLVRWLGEGVGQVWGDRLGETVGQWKATGGSDVVGFFLGEHYSGWSVGPVTRDRYRIR